jgi:hypothetical protein
MYANAAGTSAPIITRLMKAQMLNLGSDFACRMVVLLNPQQVPPGILPDPDVSPARQGRWHPLAIG